MTQTLPLWARVAIAAVLAWVIAAISGIYALSVVAGALFVIAVIILIVGLIGGP